MRKPKPLVDDPRYPPTTAAKLTPAQNQLLRRLKNAGGQLPLDDCSNLAVAGLIRRGLLEHLPAEQGHGTVRLLSPPSQAR